MESALLDAPLMGRAAIVVLALVWVQRTYLKERHDVAEKGIPLANPGIAVSAKAGQVAVMFQPGDTAVTAAIKQAWDVTDILSALLAGRWEVLGQRMVQPTAV